MASLGIQDTEVTDDSILTRAAPPLRGMAQPMMHGPLPSRVEVTLGAAVLGLGREDPVDLEVGGELGVDRHQRRVDLVVAAVVDHPVGQLPAVGRGGLGGGAAGLAVVLVGHAQPSPSSYAWSSRSLPGFMMLLGSSIRLSLSIRSNWPPSSAGTSSTSPSRVAPWQAEMDPPASSDTWVISRFMSVQARQLASSRRCSQMPMSISTRKSPQPL